MVVLGEWSSLGNGRLRGKVIPGKGGLGEWSSQGNGSSREKVILGEWSSLGNDLLW